MDLFKKIKNYTYNQRHCLGEGSFGRVYEGKSDDNLKVAIKKVEQRMISKDPYLRSSLQTEISVMKKLNHHNIVKLYDIVLTTNSIYLIMQFCGGGDLKRYCRNRKISEEEANRIIQQISRGFQQIVKHGIIHRDLKPANILVHEGVFKICDFGFAKFFSDTSKMAKTCVGTPIYMSPQVLNQKSYTNKTDIWSLGVLYFELLFNRLPFYGSSQNQLYRNIMKGLSIPSCSKNTAYLLKAMLQVEESKRFSWNNLFQYFQLGKVEDAQKQIFPVSQDIPKSQPENNLFYRQKETQENPPPPPVHVQNFMAPEIQNRNYQDSPQKGPVKNYLKAELSDEKDLRDRQSDRKNQPQRKPKNPLAFQNVQPTSSLNNGSVKKVQEPVLEENPRFYYFVLIQLIVNPLQNCDNYPRFISSLYRTTSQLYEAAIKQHKQNKLYSKILCSEYEEIKSLSPQIPNYVGSGLKGDAQSLLKQAYLKNRNKKSSQASSTKWIEKILSKDMSYQ